MREVIENLDPDLYPCDLLKQLWYAYLALLLTGCGQLHPPADWCGEEFALRDEIKTLPPADTVREAKRRMEINETAARCEKDATPQ